MEIMETNSIETHRMWWKATEHMEPSEKFYEILMCKSI